MGCGDHGHVLWVGLDMVMGGVGVPATEAYERQGYYGRGLRLDVRGWLWQ